MSVRLCVEAGRFEFALTGARSDKLLSLPSTDGLGTTPFLITAAETTSRKQQCLFQFTEISINAAFNLYSTKLITRNV